MIIAYGLQRFAARKDLPRAIVSFEGTGYRRRHGLGHAVTAPSRRPSTSRRTRQARSLAALVAIVLVGFVSAKTALPRPLDIPRSYLSRGAGKFVS
jgi:hypothetical protein